MEISVITSIHNRAHLLKWCLEAMLLNTTSAGVGVELNVMNSGSSDDLDVVLKDYSLAFRTVKKWGWDRSRSVINNPFGCPAERYNILVKLCGRGIVWKTDPEMVILDPLFLQKALDLVNKNADSFVMPFPYHCYEFPINSLEDIKNNYNKFHYPTHITKENAKYSMVYYQAVFRKDRYLRAGIDERFCGGIGSEDDHFLDWWKKEYGMDSFIPLIESPSVHLWHGGMANGPAGVPSHLYQHVDANSRLRQTLNGVTPNSGREWGRLYDHITLTVWESGSKVVDNVPLGDMT